MNAPSKNQTSQAFCSVELAPKDPILGLNEAFSADQRSGKINLAIGIYYNEEGRIPVLRCVQAAEKIQLQQASSRGYLPIDGLALYNKKTQELIFGEHTAALTERRIATFQTIGGTGGLKIGADFLHRLSPTSAAYISQPSWENHRAIFASSGFAVHPYPYLSPKTGELDFDGMLETVSGLPPKSVTVLHACCHNPTGLDLTPAQWNLIFEQMADRGVIPFFDLAYQGFGDGLDADAWAIRQCADKGFSFLVASSYSKSFSLYGERVGALSVVAQSSDECARIVSQVKQLIRTSYSNPPTHGATIVAAALSSVELRHEWETELEQMRLRIQKLRGALCDGLQTRFPHRNFSGLIRQKGMFSYSGLTPQQVTLLRERHGVYLVDTGRLCVAALSSSNLSPFLEHLADVLAETS